jgi:hypothetical protein
LILLGNSARYEVIIHCVEPIIGEKIERSVLLGCLLRERGILRGDAAEPELVA